MCKFLKEGTQPYGPPRDGVEEGPNQTDFLVTSGTDTGNDSKIMRRCRCKWERETTFRGLRIHQGRKKCKVGDQQQHCTETTGETRGTQSQVANHSAEGSNVADGRRKVQEGP